MKKSLVAMAVLAAAGAASAQSSVTLFGVVDATLAYGRGSVNHKVQLASSGYNSSRLGFRGTEDLGGGMSASFWLEAGIANDDGEGVATNSNNQASGAGAAVNGRQGLIFNRRSTVSLSSGYGELRLGRDYTPQFWNLTVFDPFGTNGVGTTQTNVSTISGPTNTRASNTVGYFLPGNLGGFYGQYQHYMGENPSGTPDRKQGTGNAARFGYAAGPINVAGAVSRTGAGGFFKANNVGGQYDFGVAKLMAHYARDKAGPQDGKGWLVGGLFSTGPGEIRAAYSRYVIDNPGTSVDPTTNKLALGYVHNLSKRTAVYTTVARLKNSDGATQALNGSTTAANNNSTGFDLGVRHSF